MKWLALLVGVSMSLALAMPMPVEAWATAPWPTAMGAAGSEGAGPDTAADTRLMLQLGMLLALLYIGFVCAWVRTTRRRRARGKTARHPRAVTHTPRTCEITWKPGPVWSRFQAVIVTSDDRRRRVVAESTGLRWPPRDARNPPTRELESALGALVASMVATGWEPVQGSGSWSERRFVWPRAGEPPTKLRPSRRRPSTRPRAAQRGGRAAGAHPVKPARRWASPGAGSGGRRAPRH
jgi:hypothetical protein